MSSSPRFGPERALPPRSFGALLRHHRILVGLTQEALAERAGLNARAISALERGLSRTPQAGTLNLLTEALQLSGEERAAFEAAARREKLHPPFDPTPLVPLSMPTWQGELPGTPASADEPDEQEDPPPQRFGPLPARRLRTSLMLGLLAVLALVAASSAVGYGLKLGPFAQGTAVTATSAPHISMPSPRTKVGPSPSPILPSRIALIPGSLVLLGIMSWLKPSGGIPTPSAQPANSFLMN